MHPAMKYGMLMTVIAHEMTHAIASNGSRLDEWGQDYDWMTIQDRMEFDALEQRMIDLYNRFIPLPEYPDIHINGEKSLEENMADLCGLEVAQAGIQRGGPGRDGAQVLPELCGIFPFQIRLRVLFVFL